jgi:hypothetical protein
LTFKILTSNGKVIHRSVVHSATGSGAFRIADQAATDNGTTDSHPFASPANSTAEIVFQD